MVNGWSRWQDRFLMGVLLMVINGTKIICSMSWLIQIKVPLPSASACFTFPVKAFIIRYGLGVIQYYGDLTGFSSQLRFDKGWVFKKVASS